MAWACYKEEFLHMSFWISIVGEVDGSFVIPKPEPASPGLLIMMGQHARSEALFYYFRLEDQVPENHLLRLIEKECTGSSFSRPEDTH